MPFPVMPGPVMPFPVMPGPVMPFPVMPGPDRASFIQSGVFVEMITFAKTH
jgi:hypothetical protein